MQQSRRGKDTVCHDIASGSDPLAIAQKPCSALIGSTQLSVRVSSRERSEIDSPAWLLSTFSDACKCITGRSVELGTVGRSSL